jgi:hypothetical protein
MSNLSLKFNPKSFAEAVAALDGRDERVIGHNTKLVRRGNHIAATYHNNAIVQYSPDGVYASWAGWATTTTATRLNKLTDARFNIKQFEPHVNGEPVSSRDWTKVS